jgi:hypothetical protein
MSLWPRSGVIHGAILLTAVGCSFGQTDEARYDSYTEAEQAGALYGGGYLPMLLPKSAIRIIEEHNASTYRQLVTFAFDETDRAAITTGCRSLGIGQVKPPHLLPTWWPKDLAAVPLSNSPYSYFYCPIDEGYLALTKDTAFFWRE